MHPSESAAIDLQPRASLVSVGLIIAASAWLAFVIEPHISPAVAPAAHHAVMVHGATADRAAHPVVRR
jgi:hypothetical protein